MKNTKQLFATLILTFGVLFHVHAQSWLTNGLVAYYPFNGNPNDESGNGHHGTNLGDVVLVTLTNGVDGTPNSAYLFAGVVPPNQIVGTGVNLANSSLSVSLWFKRGYPEDTNHDAWIMSLGSVGQAGKTLNICVEYGAPSRPALRFSFFYDDFDITSPRVGLGKWSHIVCTFDNSTRERRIYVDGSLIATNIAAYGFSGDGNFHLHGGGNSTRPALLDQVRFYNRVLSSNEVATLRVLESGPHVDLIKAVKPALSGLFLGTNYQLQLSGDLLTWTNHGAPFAATNISVVYPEYFDVDNWNKLFFRLEVAP
ncbi:MAG: LamG domain-containing protein [Verrucomicrobia bacterium]|nr:LamG domain-containing protein [Verrucomicrobiota bacterium]